LQHTYERILENWRKKTLVGYKGYSVTREGGSVFDPRKSARRDKVEGVKDIAKGQIKRAAGTLTGDEGKKAEGRKDQIKGAAKWGKGRLKDFPY
jgi:uncharacterized protein YjbJ (UPF0337 family)